MCRELLLRGEKIQMKSMGRSLEPLVMSGETIHLDPVCPGVNSDIGPGDIVFCHVQPRWRYYIHLVWAVYRADTEHEVGKQVFVIGNNKKGDQERCNGYAFREHLYGLLTRTSRGNYDPWLTAEDQAYYQQRAENWKEYVQPREVD